MAEGQNMGKLLFSLHLVLWTNCVSSKFCLNEGCTDPITSARIGTPFETKDVHFFVGDEIDILSKSDDGSYMEYEIGGIKGTIPTKNLKKSSFKIDEEILVHVPELHDEDDDNDQSHDVEVENPDDLQDEMEESSDDYIPQETKKSKKQRKKSFIHSKLRKVSVVPPKKNSNLKSHKETRKAKNTEQEGEVQGVMKKAEEGIKYNDAKEEISVKDQVVEALAPGSKGNVRNEEKASGITIDEKQQTGVNEQTSKNNEKFILSSLSGIQGAEDFKAAVRGLDNYKIMKKRYVQDYLDTNHADEKVDETIRKQVEDFIEEDMMEQMKDPESDLLQMLLNYDSKDLPGGSAEEGGTENNGVAVDENEGGTKLGESENIETASSKKEELNVDSSAILSQKIKTGDGTIVEKNILNTTKEVRNSSVLETGDIENKTEGNLPDNEKKASKESVKSEKEQPGNAIPLEVEQTEPKKSMWDGKNQDLSQHPNFPALKKKYVDSYLSTHYKSKEVSPHMKLMVENLVGSDLVQQLKNDAVMREELLRRAPDDVGRDAVKSKISVEEGKIVSPSHEKTPQSTNEPTPIAAKDDVKNENSDNIVHSTITKVPVPEEVVEAKPRIDGEQNDTRKEGDTSRGKHEKEAYHGDEETILSSSSGEKDPSQVEKKSDTPGMEKEAGISHDEKEVNKIHKENGAAAPLAEKETTESQTEKVAGTSKETSSSHIEKETDISKNEKESTTSENEKEANASRIEKGKEANLSISDEETGDSLTENVVVDSESVKKTATKPIPPAGGKDSQSLIDESIDKAKEMMDNIDSVEATEENLNTIEEKRSEEKDEETLNDSSQSNKDAVKEEQIEADKESLEPSEDDKVTNKDDDSSFSFKKLGSVLTDRFKAFAKQMVSSDEEANDAHGEDKKQKELGNDIDHPETSESTPSESFVMPSGSESKLSLDMTGEPDKEIITGSETNLLKEDREAEKGGILENKEKEVATGGFTGSQTTLVKEDIGTKKDSISENTEKVTTGVLSGTPIHEKLNDDAQSSETASSEKQTGGSDTTMERDRKSSNAAQKIDLVTLTASVRASGSDSARESGDSAYVHKQRKQNRLATLLQPSKTNSGSNSDGEDKARTTEFAEKAPVEGGIMENDIEDASAKIPGNVATEFLVENAEKEKTEAPEVDLKIVNDIVNQEDKQNAKEQDAEFKAEPSPVTEVKTDSAAELSDVISNPNSTDTTGNITPEENSSEKLVDSVSEQDSLFGSDQVVTRNLKNIEEPEEYSTDTLLELCNSQPSLPECDRLRGAKIYRGRSNTVDKPEEPIADEKVGRLERAWRNLVKIMKRIKLMKLGFVKLFHGPLSVMGLEDISHWVHEQIEHASPEVITISACCLLLVGVLVLRSVISTKQVRFGASAYDVHKMRQSRQNILEKNTEDMHNELSRLREIINSKDSEINSGGQSYKELESRLNSLQAELDAQESLLNEAHFQNFPPALEIRKHSYKYHASQPSTSSAAIRKRSSSSLVEKIRRELDESKSQQKSLHEMMEEKEQEIQEADNMALRHQSEIERQKEISDVLNDRLEKVVNELDLKDGVVLELQEKNGALRVELENLEMEKRQIEKERDETSERCKELEQQVQAKEEENGKLQDDMDEKENEIDVLRECMAQINNGKLDGEAVEDFETPEEDPDIKEQLKTERLKQIVESTQSLANLKKCEKEKEYFQEGYLEELEKREKAEEEVKKLKEEVEQLSKDVKIFKNSSTEYHIKLETLQHYFKQQETELHRKLSVEEQNRLDFQKKYEEIIGHSNSAVEETSTLKSQNEDLKIEIKEMERSIKDMKIAAEKETHELWIKNRQINRDLEEMKRERDIYRKRLLEAETAKKSSAASQVAGVEKSRDSPAGSDDGRPASPGSQKSAASGVQNFMIRPQAMFPPPPPPLFPPMHMPLGPMPPHVPQFPQLPPMMGRPQGPMSGPMPSSGLPMGPATNAPTGPSSMTQAPPPVPPGQFNAMSQPNQFGVPATSGFQSNPTMASNFMDAPPSNRTMASQQPLNNSSQSKPQMPRRDSQKSLTSSGGRPAQGQTTPVMQRRFQPQQNSSLQGPMQSTPINSPNASQPSHLPPSHPSLLGTQSNQPGRLRLQGRTMSNDIA